MNWVFWFLILLALIVAWLFFQSFFIKIGNIAGKKFHKLKNMFNGTEESTEENTEDKKN